MYNQGSKTSYLIVGSIGAKGFVEKEYTKRKLLLWSSALRGLENVKR